MSLIYSVLMSMDGYVEDEQARFDFAQPDEDVHAYINLLGDGQEQVAARDCRWYE